MSSRTRSDFGTLGERTEATPDSLGTTTPLAEPGTPDLPQVRVVDARHVWVDGRHAGLLLAWRRLGVWQGRVFWCPPDAPEPALDWIDQERLQPRDPH